MASWVKLLPVMSLPKADGGRNSLDSSLPLPFKLVSMPPIGRPWLKTSGHVHLENVICCVRLQKQRAVGGEGINGCGGEFASDWLTNSSSVQCGGGDKTVTEPTEGSVYFHGGKSRKSFWRRHLNGPWKIKRISSMKLRVGDGKTLSTLICNGR